VAEASEQGWIASGPVVGLTDHDSVPYDSEDTFHNVFNFRIGVNGKPSEDRKLDPDRWYQMDVSGIQQPAIRKSMSTDIRWSSCEQNARAKAFRRCGSGQRFPIPTSRDRR
jgi:hypothetical protein